MKHIIDDYDGALADIRQPPGPSITAEYYLGLSASRFLNPVLKTIREAFPDLQLSLYDLSPVEQLDALERVKSTSQ